MTNTRITTKAVWDKDTNELLGYTVDEYVAADELIDAINHSGWGWCTLNTDRDGRFTKEVVDQLNAMSAEQIQAFIQENNGILIRYTDDDGPEHRNVFPVFEKGHRKGYSNFNKEPEVFFDRWYSVADKDECILKDVA